MNINDFLFIYSRDGVVKTLNYEKAIEVAKQMEDDGWKHTATIGVSGWIEWLCNTAGEYGITPENAINELRGIKSK